MKIGDTFIWLHSESDNRFGELCEIVSIYGDKVDYRFVDRPNWKGGIMPMEWAVAKKEYSNEEISAIKKRYKQKRRLFAGIF